MLRKKLGESLTARIFLITVLILLCAGAVTFGLIALATPMTYTSVINDDLTRQVDVLLEQLSNTTLADSGDIFDEFIRTSGADVMLVGPDGQTVDTGSQLAMQPAPGSGDQAISWSAEDGGGNVTVTMSEQSTLATEVRFAGSDTAYTLYVSPRLEVENVAVRALGQMAPWLLLALLIFSLLCALVYSRYITRPIVRLSGIAGRMSELDFNWECPEQRRDEIGALGRSLNCMSRRLSTALSDLEEANHALRGEVEQERELDRQRMAFFSAASHELKTPVTILKGQLTGMLDGVGVYRDRDKYLLRSLQVTGRMENLIQEMLSISRMETGSVTLIHESVGLSELIGNRLALDAPLLEQRRQTLVTALTPGVNIIGDPSLLGKAVGNLLSNASLYSPEGAEVRVWCGYIEQRPALTVENTGAHIQDEALPHLFEAFYREDGSRSRSTGGSGLGLYIVRMILQRHGAGCTIENTAGGVRATVVFSP